MKVKDLNVHFMYLHNFCIWTQVLNHNRYVEINNFPN